MRNGEDGWQASGDARYVVKSLAGLSIPRNPFPYRPVFKGGASVPRSKCEDIVDLCMTGAGLGSGGVNEVISCEFGRTENELSTSRWSGSG